MTMAGKKGASKNDTYWKEGAYGHVRLCDSCKKVRRVVCLIYMEDLEKVGKGYYDLLGWLDHYHIPAIVSPIHDRDHFTAIDVLDWCTRHLDPETGDLDTHYVDSAPYVGKPKKPHIHLGIMITAQQTAQEFTEMLDGCVHIRPSMWEKMVDYNGFVRYCAHLDSPDKAKYSAFDVKAIAGADLTPISKLDEGERVTTMKEIFDFIRERDIKNWHTLLEVGMDSGDIDWANILMTRGQVFVSYFSSKRWQKRDELDAKRYKLEQERRAMEDQRRSLAAESGGGAY